LENNVTNRAISAVLEHFCNEARNSAHATLGAIELLRELAPDPAKQAFLAIGSASADQLMRSIDDVRELLSEVSPAPKTVEEFDLALSAAEIVEALNLTSGRRTRHMVLESPGGSLPITQDRRALEQVATRVLGTAFKLARTCEVRVRLSSVRGHRGAWLAIAARDADLAGHLIGWLNADLEQVDLRDPDDVPFGIPVMVAGKGLRALGGSAELARDAAGHVSVVLDLPSLADSIGAHATGDAEEPYSNGLNVLVAEDCDESFVLSEMMLQKEQVWRARDGREALRMLQKQRFDMVLMDVHMPGMDGYAAIRGMRDWETQTGNARTPIVLLSSDDLETQRRGAAQCGCSGFLRKPLRVSDLTALLDRLKQTRLPMV
jgi:two-component system, sensor histidine kinase